LPIPSPLLPSSLMLPWRRARSRRELLNVSYDPTHELYVAINKAFAAEIQGDTGKTIDIKQSH